MYWHWCEGDVGKVGAISLRPFLLPAAQGGNMSAYRINRQNKPLSKAEKAAIATNESAWTIIHNEEAARESKTERLRKERLAREGSEPLIEKPAGKRPRRSRG
ncbi:hypothetical protein Rhsp01_22000 [Rhizobium sp. NBRC 114257]|nr:hypothetical protein Rhsp01_22000 [Rhizobium sp. NBRC 114257]